MKKNTSIQVDIQKLFLFVVENKIIFFVVILFLLTFKIECGNKEGKVEWSVSCVPLRIQDVKEVVK